MSSESKQDEDFGRDDEAMARLLRMAGTRAPIPGEIESRIYDRVRDEWRASSQQPEGARVYAHVHRQWARDKRRPGLRRLLMPAALAAAAIMAIAVVVQPPPPVTSLVPVGTIARVVGGVDTGSLPEIGHPIYPGESLSTGAGQALSILLSNAESLRIDENTMLHVRAADEFQLLQGRLYADTGDFMYRDQGLVIETSMGSVTDVGTQFSVAIADDLIDVAVREGRVDISRATKQFVAVAGERLKIRNGDSATVESLAANDAYWGWATTLAPVFDIENKSLLDFLRWAARETGRELVFESTEIRMLAMRTDLHGSVSDIEPLDAIESVLATTKFHYRIEPDRIVIEQ